MSKELKNLFHGQKKNQIKKIIYISSLDVELDNTEYAYSKKQAEQLIIDSNLAYVIIRPAVIFGKADTKNFGILNKLIVRFPLVILPNKGSFLWQPVHVDDCVNLMISSLSTTNFDQQIITIVGPEKISFERIVKQLIKATGKSKKIIKIPNWVSYLVLLFGRLCFQKNKVRSLLASFQTKLPSSDTQVIKGKKSLQDEFCS